MDITYDLSCSMQREGFKVSVSKNTIWMYVNGNW